MSECRGNLVITRCVGRAVVLKDQAGREVARVTLAAVAGGRARLAVAAVGSLTISRDEVAPGWRPRVPADGPPGPAKKRPVAAGERGGGRMDESPHDSTIEAQTMPEAVGG